MEQQPATGTVSIAFVREVLAAAAYRGRPAAPLLASAQIPEALLDDPRSRVTPAQFGALWLAVGHALGDELFGLDARRVKIGSFALITRSVVGARNLREALIGIARFFQILLDDFEVRFEADTGTGQEAAIRIVDVPGAGARMPAEERAATRRLAHEALLVIVLGLACWLVARRIPVRHAALAYPRPEWAGEYTAIFAPELSFDAPVTQLSFDALLLAAPVAQNARTVSEFLLGAPGNFILKYRNENSLAHRVRQQLRARAPADWPSFEVLADEFHIGATTLRRRLEREGTSFSRIRDAVRRDLAIQRLQSSEQSITDIALALGFAEPSAFHRAFKQWTGLRPGAYRQHHTSR